MVQSSQYLSDLASKGLRPDGRKEDELRKITVETGVIEKAEGSARVVWGKTEVVAGIKMGVGEPFPDKQDEGILIANAEFSPVAAPDFERGPPGEDAIELARVVDKGIRESKTIDMKKLCIKKKEKVWMVFVDIYILNHDGNLMDASSLATTAALLTTKMPKYDKKEDKVDHEVKKDKLPVLCKPIEVTHVKIGDKLFLDPGLEEDEAADARLTVALKDNGNICAMQKGGRQGFTKEELDKMLKVSVEKAKELRKLL